MRTIRFGRTNVQVPVVSLGTWGQGGPQKAGEASVGWSGNDDAQATAALLRAHQLGITHWDTADVYGDGHAEALIGTMWDRVPRADIFLASKVGWYAGDYGHFYHPELMRKQLERSLAKLQTDVIDLHYFHHCDFGENDEYFDDANAQMRRLREEGKIRFIGLSDWDAAKIVRLAPRVDPDVVQPYRNVVDDDYASSGLREWVDNNDAGVAFFSPLKHGLLLGKYSEPQHFPEGDHRRRVPEFEDAEAIERMQVAAAHVRRHFAGEAEPVLHAVTGALLTDAPTGCVLVGQRTPRHVEAAALIGAPLTEAEGEWVRHQYAPV
jgi:aryl-alcohol dehydrogenase-like predicted oxidoreductase